MKTGLRRETEARYLRVLRGHREHAQEHVRNPNASVHRKLRDVPLVIIPLLDSQARMTRTSPAPY